MKKKLLNEFKKNIYLFILHFEYRSWVIFKFILNQNFLGLAENLVYFLLCAKITLKIQIKIIIIKM